jgi:hypothetical protein
MNDSKIVNVFDILVKLHDEGYEEVTMVVGSDRVADFKKIMEQYNGVEGKRHGFYDFKRITVKSAGERDPDATGVEGMSASKMRKAVLDNDPDSFRMGLPSGFRKGQELFKILKKEMGVMESFKEWINEGKSSPKDAEKVETDIALCLGILNRNKKMRTEDAYRQLIEEGRSKAKSGYFNQIVAMLNRIRSVESVFNYPAQTDNTLFSEELKKYNITRPQTLKSDVLFIGSGGKKYRISVKLDGSYVLASAHSKKNFISLFNSALDSYVRDFPTDESVEVFKENISNIGNDIVGKKLHRVITEFNKGNSPEEIKDKVLSKLGPNDDPDIFMKAVDDMIKVNKEQAKIKLSGVMDEYYDWMEGDMRKSAIQFISDTFNLNKMLRNYIVYESITGQDVFDGSDSAANYVLTPKKFIEIKSPTDEQVKKIASQMSIDFRGLPDKSGSYKRISKWIKGKLDSKNYFDMVLGLKLDVRVSESVQVMDEGFFNSIKSSISKYANKIKLGLDKIIGNIKNIFIESLGTITNIKDMIKNFSSKYDITIRIKF